jgi:hypothetical protein
MRMMVAAICGFLAIAIPQPASAGAWCAWYDVYTYNCGFYTLQQCQQTILGDFGAYCARISGNSNERESSIVFRSNRIIGQRLCLDVRTSQ